MTNKVPKHSKLPGSPKSDPTIDSNKKGKGNDGHGGVGGSFDDNRKDGSPNKSNDKDLYDPY